MKRKLDKNKIYAFLGKTIVWTSIWFLLELGIFNVIINYMTIYK